MALLERWDERNQRITEYQLQQQPRVGPSGKTLLAAWLGSEIVSILLLAVLPFRLAISALVVPALTCFVWTAVTAHRRRRDWNNRHQSDPAEPSLPTMPPP